MEARLQTADSSGLVYSMISVHRLLHLMVPRFCWLDLRLQLSLYSMYGLPVSTCTYPKRSNAEASASTAASYAVGASAHTHTHTHKVAVASHTALSSVQCCKLCCCMACRHSCKQSQCTLGTLGICTSGICLRNKCMRKQVSLTCVSRIANQSC